MKHSPPAILKASLVLFFAVMLAACGSGAISPTAAPSSTPADPVAGVASGPTATSLPDAAASTVKHNLNTASADDFLTVPNVGNRMVREFMEYRPYTSILQFRREIGKYVDEQQVAEYEQYVFVPVDVNQADPETLKQLPGVDDALAAELVAGRPYASLDDFLAKLSARVSAAQLEAARSYVVMP